MTTVLTPNYSRSGRWVILLATMAVLYATSLSAGSVVVEKVVLVDGQSHVIGTFVGLEYAADLDGIPTRGYLTVSRLSHLAVLLPNGRIGAVSQLVFRSPDCSGQPFVRADAGEAFNALPGSVFSHPGTHQLLYVSATASAETVRSLSAYKKVHRDAPFQCLPHDSSHLAHAALANDSDVTGIEGSGYTAPVHIVRQISSFTVPKTKTPEPVDSEPNANESDAADRVMKSHQYYRDRFERMVQQIEDGDEGQRLYGDNVVEGICAEWCDLDDLGDGFCDSSCDFFACGFDDGDCEPR